MKKQRGFTILEVSLFLAISTLVAVVLLAGLRFLVHQQQWRDSMNTMRTLIQNEYQNVRAGLNDRTDLPEGCAPGSDEDNIAGTSNCFAIGRVIRFTVGSSEYSVSDVFAMSAVDPEDTTNARDDVTALNSSGLNIANTSTSNIPWRNTFSRGVLLGAVGTHSTSFDTIAVLRSPISSAILVFGLDGTGSITSGSLPSTTDTGQFNSSMAFLVANSDGGIGVGAGAVCIAPGAASSNIQIASPVDLDITLDNLRERCRL